MGGHRAHPLPLHHWSTNGASKVTMSTYNYLFIMMNIHIYPMMNSIAPMHALYNTTVQGQIQGGGGGGGAMGAEAPPPSN